MYTYIADQQREAPLRAPRCTRLLERMYYLAPLLSSACQHNSVHIHVNNCMSDAKKPKTPKETSIDLISALVEQDRITHEDSELQWVRVAGRLAAMITRWSRDDYTIRSELTSIQESRPKKK